MTRICAWVAMLLISFPVNAHMSCSDLAWFSRSYGKNHARSMVLISISSYITGYISSVAVLGDELSGSIDERVTPEVMEWVINGISETKFHTYKSLFLAEGVGAFLINEDNYNLAVDKIMGLCAADPTNTVINLLEETVIPEMTP